MSFNLKYITSRIIFIILILVPLLTFGQNSIKLNATTLIGIPNIGFETTLGKHTTFQVDVAATFGTTDDLPYKLTFFIGDNIISPLGDPSRQKAIRTNSYGPYRFATIFPELRYYIRKSNEGFFVGVHIGGATYKLQKWNHPNDYQEGYSVFYGATIGYQFILNDKLNLELFLGGGNQQGYYKGYSLKTGERTDGATNYNISGEWLPYRGGLMLVYKFKKKEKSIQN